MQSFLFVSNAKLLMQPSSLIPDSVDVQRILLFQACLTEYYNLQQSQIYRRFSVSLLAVSFIFAEI